MESDILNSLKNLSLDDSLLDEIDILEKKLDIYKKMSLIGNDMLLLKGFKYILQKHNNICIYIPERNKFEYKISWTCTTNSLNKKSKVGFIKRELIVNSNIINYLKKCINDENKIFAAVFLGLEYYSCKDKEIKPHANLLIYNKLNNTIERFDPIGSKRTKYDNSKLDSKLYDYFIKYGIKYKSPNDICPNISFQRLQSKEDNKQIKHGLCASWSLWFLDLKLSNPHIKTSKKLIKLALNKLNEKHSKVLTNFIINYIKYIIV